MKKNDDKAATNGKGRKLRSLEWFNNPHNPGMTALYLERYLNYGLTKAELTSGKPIIGIAQTGSDAPEIPSRCRRRRGYPRGPDGPVRDGDGCTATNRCRSGRCR